MALEVVLGAVGYEKPAKLTPAQRAEQAEEQASINKHKHREEVRSSRLYRSSHHFSDIWVVIIVAALLIAVVWFAR